MNEGRRTVNTIPHLVRCTVVCVCWLVAGCAAVPQQQAMESPAEMVTVATPSPASRGAIYRAGYEAALFEDIKAQRVGDILTVLLVEKTDASKKASTSTKKDNDFDIKNPTFFGNLGGIANSTLANQLNAKRDFNGEGDSSQSNSLNGNITVVVKEVLANGNLRVSGQKMVTINQGSEYVRLEGFVRPLDVSPDNTVLSTKIANARVSYSGSGVVADANSMGWLSRFFNSVLWPY